MIARLKTLYKARFWGEGADLREAPLAGASLARARLRGANLAGADLAATDLRGATLHLARLNTANLISADLTRAHMFRANLTRANLRAARLNGANLHEAVLCGADLTGADLANAILTGAFYDTRTRWPVDFDPRLHGARNTYGGATASGKKIAVCCHREVTAPFRLLLERAGYTVVINTRDDQLASMIAAEHPDLILLDLTLRRAPRFRPARAFLHATSSLATVPIVEFPPPFHPLKLLSVVGDGIAGVGRS